LSSRAVALQPSGGKSRLSVAAAGAVQIGNAVAYGRQSLSPRSSHGAIGSSTRGHPHIVNLELRPAANQRHGRSSLPAARRIQAPDRKAGDLGSILDINAHEHRSARSAAPVLDHRWVESRIASTEVRAIARKNRHAIHQGHSLVEDTFGDEHRGFGRIG
jgi:hypothetical protein